MRSAGAAQRQIVTSRTQREPYFACELDTSHVKHTFWIHRILADDIEIHHIGVSCSEMRPSEGANTYEIVQ